MSMRAGRRYSAVALILALLLTACGPSPSGNCPDSADPASDTTSTPVIRDTELYRMAQTAYRDMLGNYWEGGADDGHIRAGVHCYPFQPESRQITLWDHATMLFAMDTLYTLNGDDDIRTRISAQWEYTKEIFTQEQLINAGFGPNIAVDDTGWNAMALMLFYRYTGDEYALRSAGKLMHSAYDYYKDGDTQNGLWYPHNPPSQGGDATKQVKGFCFTPPLITASWWMIRCCGST